MNGIDAWVDTINNLEISRIDEDCLNGLNLLITLDSFKSIRVLVKDKLKEIKEYQDNIKERDELKKKLEIEAMNKLKAAEIDKAEVHIQLKKGSTASIQKVTVGDLIEMHNSNLNKEILVVPMDMTGQMLKPVKMTIKRLIQEISMTMPIPRKGL
jgi:hypothetical protein